MKYGFLKEPEELFLNHYDLAKKIQLQNKKSDFTQYSISRHNQLNTSSCVANAVVKGLEIINVLKNGKDSHVDLSRLSLYYLTRELMGSKYHKQDNGSYISTAADVLRRFGVCRESKISEEDRAYWPFDVEKVNISPTFSAMRSAYKNKISAFFAIHSDGDARVEQIITSLYNGCPVVFGTNVYNNIRNIGSSVWEFNSGEMLGGHAMILVGWDGSNFILENSWGNKWGDDGFCRVSPSIIVNKESSDFISLAG